MPLNEASAKIKGVADVVFVMDHSGSMADLIQGVKEHVANFVHDLLNDPQSTVQDVRLGLVTHDVMGKASVHWAPFVSTADAFQKNLEAAPEGHDEFGLPALDAALDFPWRPLCRRYVLFFTDEEVDGGAASAVQREKLMELCQKAAQLHVHFVGFGPSCSAYELVGKVPGSEYNVTDRENLSKPDMGSLLRGIAKTVSSGVDERVTTSVSKNLYGLSGTRPS